MLMPFFIKKEGWCSIKNSSYLICLALSSTRRWSLSDWNTWWGVNSMVCYVRISSSAFFTSKVPNTAKCWVPESPIHRNLNNRACKLILNSTNIIKCRNVAKWVWKIYGNMISTLFSWIDLFLNSNELSS